MRHLEDLDQESAMECIRKSLGIENHGEQEWGESGDGDAVYT